MPAPLGSWPNLPQLKLTHPVKESQLDRELQAEIETNRAELPPTGAYQKRSPERSCDTLSRHVESCS